MPKQVLMPQLGESVEEGTITKWLKASGDPIAEFEPLVEINTDKVDTEIPSPAAGVLLEILAQEGATVRVGTILAIIGEAGETAADVSAAAGAPAEQTAEPETPVEQDLKGEKQPAEAPAGLGFISPVVARMAAEHKIDLARLRGTGLGGRITKKDVEAYLAQKPEVQTGKQPPVAQVAAAPISAAKGKIVPLNTVRRAIADHMLLSKHTSPHVTTIMEADLSQVIAHRQANKDLFARDGVNLTYTAYFIKAIADGLKAYPIVNSSWREEGILVHREINIGMATSLGDAGLIVPVIKNADSLSLLGLARMVNDLAQRARNKQLKPDEVQEGTFTITNHGINGSLFATPIINQPQCAILGVGAVQKRVIVASDAILGDSIAIRPMVYISLTFDHRILDGALADHFLAHLVKTLEGWPQVKP